MTAWSGESGGKGGKRIRCGEEGLAHEGCGPSVVFGDGEAVHCKL